MLEEVKEREYRERENMEAEGDSKVYFSKEEQTKASPLDGIGSAQQSHMHPGVILSSEMEALQ